MEARPAERAPARVPTAVPSWPAAAPGPRATPRAAVLDGATAVAEASRGHLSVRIGLWVDERGGVRQARWRATDDRAVGACAEAACALIESGAESAACDEATLGRAAPGAGARAGLVAGAVRAALALR